MTAPCNPEKNNHMVVTMTYDQPTGTEPMSLTFDQIVMTCDIVCWNTGRPYTKNGQRISATLIDGVIYFSDIDRGIAGQIEPSADMLPYVERSGININGLMSAYDKCEYKELSYGSDIRSALDNHTLNQ